MVVVEHTMTNPVSTVTHKNSLAIVQKMYACFNRGDMASLKSDVFAPDIVWILPGRHPLSGIKYGADQVIAFFTQLNKAGIIVDLIGLDQFHEDTVVEVHRGHTADGATGPTLDALNCTHYQIVDDKIKHVQVYISDQYSVDTFFWAAFQLQPIPERLAQ
jgi:ketosteroid isomerase-like protein